MRIGWAFLSGVVASLVMACSSGSKNGVPNTSQGGSGGVQDAAQGGAINAGGTAGSVGGSAMPMADVHCEAFNGGCTCVGDPNHLFAPDSLSCTESISSFCCADELDYPARGACQCQHWGCTDNGTGCACGNGTGTLPTCPSSYGRCCSNAVNHTCDCGSAINPCAPDQTEVPGCLLDDVQCLGTEVRVFGCDGRGEMPTTSGSGGTGSGGGPAGTAGGGGTGVPPTYVGCKNLPLCDDFEGQAVGATADPSKWSQTTCSDCTPVAPLIDDAEAHSGLQSLKAGGSTNFIQSSMIANSAALAAIGHTVFGRFYILVTKPLPTGNPPGSLLSFLYPTQNETFSFVYWNGSFAWHRVSTDAILPGISGLGVSPSINRWYCVEFKLDELQGLADTWVDGKALPQVNMGFSFYPASFNLGWERVNDGGTTLWFDDVAFAAERVGCCIDDSECDATAPSCSATTHLCSTRPN
jgi:hypothetical protein